MKSIKKDASTQSLVLESTQVSGDIFGGIAAMMVALPSAIAFGLVIYGPLGATYSGMAAIAGVMGTIAIGITAALTGRTSGLISAPCAPAAAVLAVFTGEIVTKGSLDPTVIPLAIALIGAGAGIIQFIIGRVGGGALIKYIPYPVVAGYLSGVGVLIFTAQLPKCLGAVKGTSMFTALSHPSLWQWESIFVGGVTIAAMLLSGRFIKKIPAAIIALFTGLVAYFLLAFFQPSLFSLDHNSLVIGPIAASPSELIDTVTAPWRMFSHVNIALLTLISVPMLTLAVLLSVDTLKTCVVLDALTGSRHQSNKELMGQGLGNLASAFTGGICGAGTMGATLVNINSGGRTWKSGLFMGLSALLVLLFIGRFIAWIPVAALAGILLTVAVRMIDWKGFSLLKHPSTRLDFAVILAVIISAVSKSLIVAAGVGIAMAILLFLRQQIQTPVVRRMFTAGQVFSKKKRGKTAQSALETSGNAIRTAELQGPLFFGTMDQLLTELEPHIRECRSLILDLRRAQSLDYTAAFRFKQLRDRLSRYGGCLILSSIPKSLPSGLDIREYLVRLGLTESDDLHFFPDLDAALEWAEDRYLKGVALCSEEKECGVAFESLELFEGFSVDILKVIKECLIRRKYVSGETIFHAGESGDSMYIILSGTVRITLPLKDGGAFAIASFAEGAFFGEFTFMDGRVRSANAVADGSVELLLLERKAFDATTNNHPEAARRFFERLALALSHRLRQNNIELSALQDG